LGTHAYESTHLKPVTIFPGIALPVPWAIEALVIKAKTRE
jgi:hypothetical protein